MRFPRPSGRARISLICSWVTTPLAERISPIRFLLNDVILACAPISNIGRYKRHDDHRHDEPHGQHEHRLDHGREQR